MTESIELGLHELGKLFEIAGDDVGTLVEIMVTKGLNEGPSLPPGCDRHLLIDLTTHAVQSSLKTLSEHVNRAPLGGPAGDIIMLSLITRVMSEVMNAISSIMQERAKEALLAQKVSRG